MKKETLKEKYYVIHRLKSLKQN